MNENKYLDGSNFLLCLRGFLALSVAHWHLPIEHNYILPGRLSVIFFFGISGFSIFSKLNSCKINLKSLFFFYRSRARRVYPALFFSIVLILVFNSKVDYNFNTILEHLFFLKFDHNYTLNGVLWTLGVEMQFYIIAPFIIIFSNLILKNNLYLHVFIFLFFSFLPLLSSIFLKKYSILDSRNVIGNLSHFYVSLLVLKGLRLKISKRFHIFLLSFVIFISVFLYYTFIKFFWVVSSPLNDFSIFLILTLLDYRFFGIKFIFLKPLIFIGKISFGIYLYHYFALSLFPFHIYGYIPWLITTIGLSIFSYKFIESYFLTSKINYFNSFK